MCEPLTESPSAFNSYSLHGDKGYWSHYDDATAEKFTEMDYESSIVQSDDLYDRTAIIIDWDDTLFPSSWALREKLFAHTESPSNTGDGGFQHDPLNPSLQERFREVEQAAIDLIETCVHLGPVFIVTAAEEGWIEYTCDLYFPNLKQKLVQNDVFRVSARAWYLDTPSKKRRRRPRLSSNGTRESHDGGQSLACTSAGEATPESLEVDNSPLIWKLEVMREIAEECFLENDVSSSGLSDMVYNLVSIGDSEAERLACHKVAESVPFALAKTLKLIRKPTVEDLKLELTIAKAAVENLCRSRASLDLQLTPSMLRALL